MKSSIPLSPAPEGELEKVLELISGTVYEKVERLDDWNGYRVYDPGFNDDEPRFIGLPNVILASDEGVRWSDYEETMAHLHDSVADDFEDEDDEDE